MVHDPVWQRARAEQHARIDGELLAPLTALLQAFPRGLMGIGDLDERRRTEASLVVEVNAAVDASRTCTVEDLVVDPTAGPAVRIRVYRPRGWASDGPALLFIHGGGLVSGDLDAEHSTAVRLCEELGALVVSTDYRKAPEHPYPSGLDDCVATFRWMVQNHDSIGFDLGRLAVWGGSAGGNLCLATAMKARDMGLPLPALLVAPYPMLDPEGAFPSGREITDVGLWDRDRNLEAWNYYLAGREADGYAAPLRGLQQGLPPTFLDVGEMDLFRDEVVALAGSLMRCGVACELHVYPGVYHAAEIFAPESSLGRQIWGTRLSAVRRAWARAAAVPPEATRP